MEHGANSAESGATSNEGKTIAEEVDTTKGLAIASPQVVQKAAAVEVKIVKAVPNITYVSDSKSSVSISLSQLYNQHLIPLPFFAAINFRGTHEHITSPRLFTHSVPSHPHICCPHLCPCPRPRSNPIHPLPSHGRSITRCPATCNPSADHSHSKQKICSNWSR